MMTASLLVPRKLVGAVAISIALLVTTLAAQPAAASGVPEWTISSIAVPAQGEPSDTGERFVVAVINTGGASTDGSAISIEDTLPGGVKVTEVSAIDAGHEEEGSLECEEAGAVVTCHDNAVVIPGGVLMLGITVEVSVPRGTTVVNHVSVSGGGAGQASKSSATTTGSGSTAQFGFSSAWSSASTTRAGDHPNFTTGFALNQRPLDIPSEPFSASVEDPKDIGLELPLGLVGDPQAVPRCTAGEVIDESCPTDSAVGIATTVFSVIPAFHHAYLSPVYSIKPNQGEPAALMFEVNNFPVRVDTRVVLRPDGQYGIRASVSEANELVPLLLSSVTLWGVPADFNGPGPYVVRKEKGPPFTFGGPSRALRRALLRNPSACGGEALATSISMNSWQQPGRTVSSDEQSLSGLSLSPAWGCGALPFAPTLSVAPEVHQAGAPSGYEVDLHVPQSEEGGGLATADLRNATVTLPAGTLVSPSSANGLQACSGGQFGLRSDAPASCPPGSQIGTVTIETPLLASPLTGDVFVGEPECSPCSPSDAREGRMVRLLIQAQEPVPDPGVLVKLAGSASINQSTGQLTTTFQNNPQLPFEDLRLHLDGGSKAPLANPRACGPATTTSDLTPWSSPLAPDATPSSTFEVEGCAPPRFAPTFTAGTVANQAAGFSPFTMTLARSDQDEQFAGVSVTTPPGLLGMLSRVSLCQEPAASNGTCGPQSLIGHVTAGAGPGSSPFYVGGQVFLTGPYRGAPFGLSIVVPAQAGPYNLGTVVVRAAISVDPATSALTVTSDPFPQQLDGVPLQLKVLNVTVDRPGFMFNPTNCKALAIKATVLSMQGATAAVSSPFAVGGCKRLAFKPEFSVTTRGYTSRAGGASLDVRLSYPKDALGSDANIARVTVSLPQQLPSRLTTLQKACPAATFAADPARCPAASIVGIVRADTPVLPVQLTGPVYFVSHGGEAFPNLIVVLQGNGVRVDLVGDTFISKRGITSSTFNAIPDVPVSTFELYLPRGRFSALAANGNLCSERSKLVMPTEFVAQNGAVIKQLTKIKVTGCAKAKSTRQARKARRAHGRGK
jgi:hypothetical protein